jgi:hypothetical protein
MNKVIIKIFSDFTDSFGFLHFMDSSFLKKYSNSEISFTNDDDYTHAIILNTCMPHLNIPKENVVGLAHEPWDILALNSEFIDYAKKHIGKYFIGDKNELDEPFIENYTYMFHNVPLKNTNNLDKSNFCSIIVSDKKYAPGHIYRHQLVERILQTNLPIDIYGRGCHFYNDSRVKQSFEQYDTTPTEQYRYHICIENHQSNNYFSEKIINPFLTNTIPIYLGCRKIEDYFPNQILYLTGNLDSDIKILTDIFNNEDNFKKNINIEKVIEVTNIFNNLDKLFTII